MKSSKAQIHSKIHRIPRLSFCEQRKLTSYSGLVIFQALFNAIRLKVRIRECFRHLGETRIYGRTSVFVLLLVHIILGFRRIRGLDYYREDPLVARVCGLRKLPDVTTVSRTLESCDEQSVSNIREYIRSMVIERLVDSRIETLTVDFDGSVQSTCGHAEGTAVGFNKKKKGARSYYPLLFFESDWKPKKWKSRYRVLVIRKRNKKQQKGPLQLDLFKPDEHSYEYKVMVTNITGEAKPILLFHNGRGSQEKLFSEAKQHAALDVIATKKKVPNQIFTLAGMLAHNLTRELHMATKPTGRGDLEKRPAKWEFQSLGTIRQHLLHNAGVLTRPQGELTLTINENEAVREELETYLDILAEKKQKKQLKEVDLKK